ncbi:MAG: hypothetical protein U0R80_16560 [Nocardioidaceae bacterium]
MATPPHNRSLRASLAIAATTAASLVVPLLGTGAAPVASAAAPTPSARLSAACLAPTPAKLADPHFGVSLSANPTLADDRATEQRRFGRLPIARIYDPSIPPSNAWERRKPQLKGMSVITSFRMAPQEVLAGRYDSQLRQFFATAPRKRDVFWSYFHEPEPNIDAGQFTARQYRRAWRHIATIAGSLCRPRLYPTLILTGWTAESASGRSWRDYYAGDRFVSVLGWDPYNQAVGTPRTYRAPRDVFGAVVRASHRSGKPWGLAETGTARVSGDGGAGRARWIARSGRYLMRKDPLFVSYFQSTNKGDFELRDSPSIRAYRKLVQS